MNQYDNLFRRKEEVLLKVDCNSSSDESVDVIDSSESDDRNRKSGRAKVEAYKLPNKGVINQKRIEKLDKPSPHSKSKAKLGIISNRY